MKKLIGVALAALALSVAHPAHLDAWGFSGHKFISDHAVDLLPPELRPFFEKYRTTFVEHSIDPDTYRTMGFATEAPHHFLDMDSWGPFPFKDLPHDYNEAVAKRGVDFVVKNGTVPWRTEEIYNHLRDAFKQLPTAPFAREDVKLFAAVMAHYVEDSFQPFHAAANYDGQLTGQQGIHARFESELFDRYEGKLTIAPAPIAPVTSAHEYVFATLTDSFQMVDPILAADRAAVQGRSAYDDGYFDQFFGLTRTMLEKRINGAITGVASMITSAWIDAGRPPVPLDVPARAPRVIKKVSSNQ